LHCPHSRFILTAKANEDGAQGEGDVVDGVLVLAVAFGILAFLWVLVLYGSTFFGPKTE
jgi:hypothetical protein